MKKRYVSLCLCILCALLYMSFVPVKAEEDFSNRLYECSVDLIVYAEPDTDSDILEEKTAGDPIYAISSGIPWTKVFVNGKEGYVMTEYLAAADNGDLANDPAFDEKELIKEYGDTLNETYQKETGGRKEKKAAVIGIAVLAVSLFAGIDIAITKYYKKQRKKKKDRQRNA